MQHKDVLLFVDNIFRFIQAGSKCPHDLGASRPLSVTSPLSPMKWVLCRNGSPRHATVPSHRSRVYVPADDLTDPAPATTHFSLDAITVLSRSVVEPGFIRVDPLESSSLS